MKLGSTDISKVYLGQTEVTKAYLGSIEVYSSAPEPLPDYISDGLVLWLDGKLKGNTADAWTDLVGGIVFTQKSSGVIFNSDNVQFDGSNDKVLISSVTGSSDYIPVNSVATLEICYNNTSGKTNRCLFYAGNYNGALCFHISNTTDIKWGAGSSQAPNLAHHTNQAKTTYSISRKRILENFVAQSFGTVNYITKGQTKIIVGGSGRNASNIYDVFNGKIYSIRIYNRQLTEEEVLHNQAIDNTRFNLGLTINS